MHSPSYNIRKFFGVGLEIFHFGRSVFEGAFADVKSKPGNSVKETNLTVRSTKWSDCNSK